MITRLRFSDLKEILPDGGIFHCNYPDAPILGVRDFEEDLAACDSRLSENFIYICTPEVLMSEAEKPLNIITYCDDPELVAKIKTRVNVIITPSAEELYKLTTKILSSIARYAKLGEACVDLSALLNGPTPLGSVINYATKELRTPCILVDSSFSYLVGSGFEYIENEPKWAFAADNMSFPPAFMGLMMEELRQAHAESARVYICNNEILQLNNRQAMIRIVFRDRTIAYLLMLEPKQGFNKYIDAFLSILADFIAQILGHNDNRLGTDSRFQEDFLISILSEAISTPEEITLKQRSYGINLKPTLRILVINLPLALMDSDKSRNFIKSLRLYFGNNIIVPYESAVVILMETDDDDSFLGEKERAGLEGLLSEYNCTANVSAPFHFLNQTRRHYTQAKMVGTLRTMLRIDDPILEYLSYIAEYHMIFNYSMVQNLDNLLHPAVIKLDKIDKATGSDMLNILFAYTEHLCNLTSTAKDLYLHYNTLKYRIDKIAGITGIDFNDSSTVHRIVLSKKVLQIKEAISKAEAE